MHELSCKDGLHTTDYGIVFLVRKPTPPSLVHSDQRGAWLFIEWRACSHIRVAIPAPLGYAGLPLDDCLPPWRHTRPEKAQMVLLIDWYECLHSTVSSHCMKCQARTPPRLTVQRPLISISLQAEPGTAISLDYFGPFLVTRRGSTYTLLLTDRFSRCTDNVGITVAKFAAQGAANVLINRHISFWGCPRSILERGPSVIPEYIINFSQTPRRSQLSTSFHHQNDNGGVERVNRTMGQILTLLVDERQDDWGAQLPHAESRTNTRSAPAPAVIVCEVHMGRLL